MLLHFLAKPALRIVWELLFAIAIGAAGLHFGEIAYQDHQAAQFARPVLTATDQAAIDKLGQGAGATQVKLAQPEVAKVVPGQVTIPTKDKDGKETGSQTLSIVVVFDRNDTMRISGPDAKP